MRFLALLAALPFLACGGGDPTPASFPAAFSQAVNGPQARCRRLASYFDQRDVADTRGLYEPDLQRAVKAGRVRFDPAQARVCLDGMNARGCDRPSAATAAACRAAVTGLVATGSPCFWLYECAQGICIPGKSGCPATCPPVVPEGGQCPGDGQANCDERKGLRCIAGTCSQLHADGNGCTTISDCAPGFFCAGGASCAPLRNELASCEANEECATGLYCQLTSAGGLCRKKVVQGKPCGEDDAHAPSAASECDDGLVCTGFVAKKGSPTPGTCSPFSDAGGPCVAADITGCAAELLCNAGRCELPPTSGPCSDTNRCLRGTAYCDAGNQCRTLKENGLACTQNNECAGGLCDPASSTCKDSDRNCHEAP